MAEIRLTDVTKRFDSTTAVDGVSLTIPDGETMGVVGPSGCGKTTLLRLVAGFETASAGSVAFGDETVTHVPPERRNVGLVFQSYALFDNMSVLENVTFGPRMHGVDRDTRRERAHELLALLDIDDLADRDPTTLSGGQQQRVGVARALAIDPEVLLLDEPMTGLDEKLKRSLRRELSELLDDLGVTTLYVTHDQQQVMSMCDRVAVMNDGRVEQVGRPGEVYESPANAFVADFVGTANLLEGTVRDGVVEFDFGRVVADLPETGSTTVAVRPDDIAVGDGPVEAVVRSRIYLGDTVHLVVELPDGSEITVETDRRGPTVERGDTVDLDIDPEGLTTLGG